MRREYGRYYFETSTGKEICIDTDNNFLIGASKRIIKSIPNNVIMYEDEICMLIKSYMYLFNNENFSKAFNEIFSYPTENGTEKRHKIFCLKMIIKLFNYNENTIFTKNQRKVLLSIIKNSNGVCPRDCYFTDDMFLHFLINCDNVIKTMPNYIYKIIEEYFYGNIAYFVLKVYREQIEKISYFSTFNDFPLKNAIKEMKKPYDKKISCSKAIAKDFFHTDDISEKNLNDIENNYGVSLYSKKDYVNNISIEIKNLLKKYLTCKEIIDDLEIEYEFSDNLIRDYNRLLEIADQVNYQAGEKMFNKRQTSINLFFENERYKISIPTSRNELQSIGNHFHNCANGYEWDNFLSRGYRYIVTVVDKKTSENVVCCDINRETKAICQYLGRMNARITNNDLKDFKKKYQDYLYSL